MYIVYAFIKVAFFLVSADVQNYTEKGWNPSEYLNIWYLPINLISLTSHDMGDIIFTKVH